MKIKVTVDSEVRLPDHICFQVLEGLANHIKELVREEVEKDGGLLLCTAQQKPVYTRSFGMTCPTADYLPILPSNCKMKSENQDNLPQADNDLE
ncbi:hypothetical protein CAPN002_23360 [Capnocytophaga stomatis]|nr:hypothetical protein CAPN002_23360 [Capnocytophaga stomatis]